MLFFASCDRIKAGRMLNPVLMSYSGCAVLTVVVRMQVTLAVIST